ncbi:hypothetical protein BHN418_06659 [Streptococcus pneumoniae BHN418]|nr:hypothetical protein BHN418_06659 [Streptococcus pneumoniae BHN418]
MKCSNCETTLGLLYRNLKFYCELFKEEWPKNYSETGLSDYNTYLFYGFILKSYKLPRENRYSIKLLVKELQNRGLKVTLIINIYYHALNCLALNDGLKIYGEDFLI